MSRRILLLSTSTMFGSGYLEYCEAELKTFFAGLDRLLFVPYARPGGMSHDAYTERARERFANIGIEVSGIHEAADACEAVKETGALFVGGGNTFVLLDDLHRAGVMEEIRARVDGGMPYLGASAGSNVAGLSIGTTNDMPIVYPPSFEGLGLVPFNINPHYIDPDPGSKHMGETRETRISEFHVFNEQPVVGLREGAMLHLEDDALHLLGATGGRLFRPECEPEELAPGAALHFLL